ncbi:MAG: glycosyltransferase [Verrucomicrobiae bacterium]|nr:glycosyltransferase [Verrucomicrobiae bacterium]
MTTTLSSRGSPLLALYYAIKPLLPRSVRYALRRHVAQRTRARSAGIWPVKSGTETPPANWPGWPQGKKFAFVLTHDVEGQKGLDRCRALANLEMESGFRSSFNFIPEGEYRVTREFRQELEQLGFEVGVHDLHHDGSLFRSYQSFQAQSPRINQYLKEWGAVGFRAGFMFHNLEWQQQLNIRYDLSTFDADPFEPQPDGMNTIYPFWVEKVDGQGGYMELPYTLVQDSTLFLFLREKSIALWKQKLDWVAQHGGMVLVNVHPDYVKFAAGNGSAFEFPSAFYAELLEYVHTRYAGQYWHALPREVADYCAKFKPRQPTSTPALSLTRTPKRVCMMTHSFYEGDTRVIRYAEALAQRGDEVEVFALRAKPEMPREEMINGVKLIRVQDRAAKRSNSKASYLFPLLRFLLVTSGQVSRRHLRRRYDFVHAHNVPDFVVFAAWLPRLTGARVILDVHDILPEFFGNKFRKSDGSLLVRALKWAEKLSAAFSHHVILGNHLWLDRYIARSAPREKCSVFINNVDRNVFKPAPEKTPNQSPVVIFPGGLQWHQGLDIAIRAFAKLRRRMPTVEFHIYGNGNMAAELQQLAKDLGLQDAVRFTEEIPLLQVADLMAHADLGVVPKRADSFGNEAYSTKIMEFMAVGVPVVISATKIDRYYFNDSVVRFFESGNADAMAEAMYEVLSNAELRRGMVERAFAYAETHSWNNRKPEYLALVDSLLASSKRASRKQNGQSLVAANP